MKKACFQTFGCKVNQYDTQIIKERYKLFGYDTSVPVENADVIVVNSCTVTAEADRQCRQFLRKAVKKNASAEVIVTGCYAERGKDELTGISPRIKIFPDRDSIIPGDDSSPGEEARPFGISDFDGHTRAFVKIQDGCDAFCSYCIVPYVRPGIYSRPENEVITEIKGLINKGVPEIVLAGIRLGKYEGGLVNILKKIISHKGSFRIRLSSLEAGEIQGDLIRLIRDFPEKICSHLHIPLQSASDKVLSAMNRPYKSAEFAGTIDMVRKLLPEAGITTDVIVGFPGETDSDYRESEDFIKRNEFSRLHVFPYSPRPGTAAKRLGGRVDKAVIKKRSAGFRALDAELQKAFWKKLIGTERYVVREGKSDTLLTDNYVKLKAEPARGRVMGVFKAIVYELDGEPWGRQG